MMGTMKLIGVLKNAYEAVLDAVFPLRERTLRTKERTLQDIPLVPTVHELLHARITTLMEYRDLAAQDLVSSL